MAAKPQPAQKPTARELFRALRPWTAENRRTIALAYLEQDGDLPAFVVYSFLRGCADHEEGAAVDREMCELRKQHFAKQGKPVPERQGAPLR